ncbi:hypothetical protein [Roseobacter ponti]|uniref:Uncharacterized protein n=1 Tax=Roseobacter ponti TaxID=1891787 RepID=A0A858SZB6_9RHOB|nr:hypothetical protein [Roseobacter ponti]QJF53338.1 hypothetical protein G3256_18805 [Roseobacter ponti]
MANRVARYIRRVFRIAVIGTVAMLIPAVVTVPAHKLEFRKVQVVAVMQVPGEDLSDRMVTVDLGHRTHKVHTRDVLLTLSPGDTACLSERTLMRDHWVIYALQTPDMCRRV